MYVRGSRVVFQSGENNVFGFLLVLYLPDQGLETKGFEEIWVGKSLYLLVQFYLIEALSLMLLPGLLDQISACCMYWIWPVLCLDQCFACFLAISLPGTITDLFAHPTGYIHVRHWCHPSSAGNCTTETTVLVYPLFNLLYFLDSEHSAMAAATYQ